MTDEVLAPFIEAMGNVLCECGHELRRHDPEDGDCDAPGDRFGACPCRCPRSSDPDYTLDELRLRAVLGVESEGRRFILGEQVGWHNERIGLHPMKVDRNPKSYADIHPYDCYVTDVPVFREVPLGDTP